MKKIFLFIISFVFIYTGKSQNITPTLTSEMCPGVNITFSVSLPGTAVTSVSGAAINIAPTVIQQPFNISTSGGNINFDFIGKFADYNNKQTFQINYTGPSGQAATYNFGFSKIKSLLTANSFSQINPTPTSIISTMCQVNNHSISFSNVQYGNPFENPPIGYGTVTNYEYLLPSGWILGGTTSTGSNWISGNNNVTVTSDLGTGDGGLIRIRPVNTACAAGLVAGQEVVIPISRPVSLSISGANSFCTGSSTYTLNGLPPSSTVSWSINNPNTAAIPNPSTGTSVSVTKVADGVVTLTATVTLCNSEVRTVSKEIVLGAYAFGTYQYWSSGPVGNSALGSVNTHFIPPNSTMTFMINLGNTDLTNIQWTNTGGYSVSVVPNGFGGCSFSLPAAPGAYSQRSTFITINASGPCGTVNRTFEFKVITQGWFRIKANPNPATDIVKVTITEEANEVKKLSGISQMTIKVTNMMNPKLSKQWTFRNNQKTVSLNISDLPRGYYIIEVTRGKFRATEKLIKL